MELDYYQRNAAKTARIPDFRDLVGLFYVSLGLAAEAGELANEIKKVWRDDGGHITGERAQELRDELGDVLWYAAMMAEWLDVDLSDVAQANLDKLQERYSQR